MGLSRRRGSRSLGALDLLVPVGTRPTCLAPAPVKLARRRLVEAPQGCACVKFKAPLGRGQRDASGRDRAYDANYRNRLSSAPEWRALGLDLRHLMAPRSGERVSAGDVHATIIQRGDTFLAKLSHVDGGSFGKFAPVMGEDGVMRAAKVLRTKARRRPGGTDVSSPAQIAREVALMRRFCGWAVEQVDYPERHKVVVLMPLAVATLERREIVPGVSAREVTRSALRQLAAQLGRMHAAGISHCDVKPHNVLLMPDGSIVAGDMGKATDCAQSQLGTPAYSAPELTLLNDASPLSGAVDVWSLAVTLIDALLPIADRIFQPTRSFLMSPSHAAFFAWRAEVLEDGVFSPRRLAALYEASLARAGAPSVCDDFTRYFYELYAKDPEICAFVLTRMMVPSGQRAGAREVAAFAARLQPENGPAEARVRAALAACAQSPRHAAWSRALDLRLRDELWVRALDQAHQVAPQRTPIFDPANDEVGITKARSAALLRLGATFFERGEFCAPARPMSRMEKYFVALHEANARLCEVLLANVFLERPTLGIARLARFA